MSKYECLMGEVAHLNSIYKWVGALDALIYLRDNIEEYAGSRVEREYRMFMREGARLFAPVPEADQYGDNALAEEF